MLIVDEIIDTGLTLSWLVNSLCSRGPASVEIATLLRKPEALSMPVEPKYIGWDIPNEFVVGYGLDYRERTATCATSAPSRPTSTPDGPLRDVRLSPRLKECPQARLAPPRQQGARDV